MTRRPRGTLTGLLAALMVPYGLTAAEPARAHAAAEPVQPAQADVDQTTAASQDSQTAGAETPAQTGGNASQEQDTGSETDILSADTFTILLDARLVLSDGDRSWVDGGLGKTRFSGTSDGDFELRAVPVEADLIWHPRFTSSLSGNVSVAWQRDQDNDVDLFEAFITFLPQQGGGTSLSAKAGLYWPEISLEHATGGAWSTVYTITPSAINSWVGEEVKLLGAEVTLSSSIGEHQLFATGGLFGLNDTSGTLLSFRGWALHDLKASAFGYFKLPPLNDFIVHLQEDRTRSLIEIDDRVGFYGRLEWRPPWPFVLNAFYYDNRGDPEAFTERGQWGWRTRFLNVGLSADLGPSTRLLAQGMTGSTIMGFETNDDRWVDTRFRAAYALVTHDFGGFAISGRAEAFGTRERGSQMSRDESEDGWALTAAGRWPVTSNLTAFLEALHVHSDRDIRANLGLSSVEKQTLLQAALRFRW